VGRVNPAPLNGLWEWDNGYRGWLGFDVRIRNGHLIDASRNDRHPHYTVEGQLKGRADDDVGFVVNLLANPARRFVHVKQRQIGAACDGD
jgi:hypothetical protein